MKVLIIINNHLTNLFMYAFYLQNKKKYLNYQFQFIIDQDIYNSKNSIIDKNLIKKFIEGFPKKITIKTIKINKNYEKFFIKNFLRIFINWKENINIINQNKLKIYPLIDKNYKEIWVGNSIIIDYFNSNNLINRFEHGIGDFATFFNKKNFIKLFKLKIENYINKKLFEIELDLKSTLRTILVLKKKIKFDNVKQIKKQFLIESINFLKIKKKFTKNNVLILYPFDEIIKNNEKTIHKGYAEYCIDAIKHLNFYKSLTSIYVKAKYNNLVNVKKFILHLKQKTNIKIKLLNISSYKNIEYYLIDMRPKVILSKINLGLYLFKKIINNKFIFINTDDIFYRLSLQEVLSKKTLKILNNWKFANNIALKFFVRH